MAKRLFDLSLAIFALLMLAPVWLIAAMLVKADSRGPILYRGERIGRGGVPFRILKFRTMVVNADRIGAPITRGCDPRITRVGRAFRHWKIDELPQLWNVVRGEMSLVGPRPEAPCYVALYTREQRRVLSVRPGITGLTQIQYRDEEALLQECSDPEQEYVSRIMPDKLALDLRYVENPSLLLDIKILAGTARCLIEPASSGRARVAVR